MTVVMMVLPRWEAAKRRNSHAACCLSGSLDMTNRALPELVGATTLGPKLGSPAVRRSHLPSAAVRREGSSTVVFKYMPMPPLVIDACASASLSFGYSPSLTSPCHHLMTSTASGSWNVAWLRSADSVEPPLLLINDWMIQSAPNRPPIFIGALVVFSLIA